MLVLAECPNRWCGWASHYEPSQPCPARCPRCDWPLEVRRVVGEDRAEEETANEGEEGHDAHL